MEKRVVVPLWGDAGPMTEMESALDDLEASWADFAYAIRPKSMARIVRRPNTNPSIRCDSLLSVHNVLEHYREKLQAGDHSAIFDALTHCAAENVPMPYWVSSAIIEIARNLHGKPAPGEQPKSLHELFGMEVRFPTSQTKALKAKRDLHLRGQLWSTASLIKHEEGTRAKRELIAAGFIHETVRGHRPNKVSCYAVTWRTLDRLPGYDEGAAATFVRGAYQKPSCGVEARSIAPSHGVAKPAPTPSHNAIRAIPEHPSATCWTKRHGAQPIQPWASSAARTICASR